MLPNLKGLNQSDIYHYLHEEEMDHIYGTDAYKEEMRHYGPDEEEDIELENGAQEAEDFERWMDDQAEQQLLDDE